MGGGQRTVSRDLSLGYLPDDAINLISLVSSWAEGAGVESKHTASWNSAESIAWCKFVKYLFIFNKI